MTDLIAMTDICKYYRMGDTTVRALDGVSLRIEKGEFTAVIGPSGSGKSTLMNIIGCLDVPTSGDYVLDGIPVREYGERELADIRNRKIGFVFQQFDLLAHLTAEENVEVPMIYAHARASRRRRRARELLEAVGLGGRAGHRPAELSGGQQQRVSIARALANDPAILLCDEPTGALDTKTGEEVLRLLQRLNAEGKTIVMITHDPRIAAHAGRSVTIRDGKIGAPGPEGGTDDV